MEINDVRKGGCVGVRSGRRALHSVVRDALPLGIIFERRALPVSQGTDFQSEEWLVHS